EAVRAAQGGGQHREERQLIPHGFRTGQLLGECSCTLQQSHSCGVGREALGFTGGASIPGERITDLTGELEVHGHLATHDLDIVRVERDQPFGDPPVVPPTDGRAQRLVRSVTYLSVAEVVRIDVVLPDEPTPPQLIEALDEGQLVDVDSLGEEL